MRGALESAIADYDEAADLEHKNHLAVVALERMRMYLQSTSEPRRRTIVSADDDDAYVWSGMSFSNGSGLSSTTRNLPIAITDKRPFEYDSITYPTVQHAFQAQKLPADARDGVASMGLWEALDAGRKASIDIDAWDANKSKLMYRLVKEQAKHHEAMIDALIEHKDADIVVDDVHDSYWPSVLPKIYKKLGEVLAEAAVLGDILADAPADASNTQGSSSAGGKKKRKEAKHEEAEGLSQSGGSSQSGSSPTKRSRKE